VLINEPRAQEADHDAVRAAIVEALRDGKAPQITGVDGHLRDRLDLVLDLVAGVRQDVELRASGVADIDDDPALDDRRGDSAVTVLELDLPAPPPSASGSGAPATGRRGP
jgi:hypothetical protein